jgi:hypothetical protein
METTTCQQLDFQNKYGDLAPTTWYCATNERSPSKTPKHVITRATNQNHSLSVVVGKQRTLFAILRN